MLCGTQWIPRASSFSNDSNEAQTDDISFVGYRLYLHGHDSKIDARLFKLSEGASTMRLAFEFGLGTFGAGIQELLWWYTRRHSLDKSNYIKLIQSNWYWIVTILFILSSGIFVVIWFYGEPAQSPRNLLLTGAAVPLLLKQGMKAATPSQHMGESKFSLRDYLQ